MRNVLVVIDNSYVRQDLDALLILEEDENVELTVLDEVPEDANDFDELVISTGIIDEATGLSIPVSRFSLSDKEEASYSGNIPSYGLCKDATMLYDRILRGKPKNNTDAKKTVKKPKKPQKAQPTTSVYEVEEND